MSGEQPRNSPSTEHQKKFCCCLPIITASASRSAGQNGTKSENESDDVQLKILREIRDSLKEKTVKNMFEKIQGSLMVVAVLAAGATYQAGLSPPGGFWQANDNEGHIAGMAVLRDTFPKRYKAFYYCNATAFIMSLVIIILLMHDKFYNHKTAITVIQITMILDLFGILGAYAAGSCRDVPSSIFLFLLMGGIFLYVVLFVLIYRLVVKKWAQWEWVKCLREKYCLTQEPFSY